MSVREYVHVCSAYVHVILYHIFAGILAALLLFCGSTFLSPARPGAGFEGETTLSCATWPGRDPNG